MIKQYISRLLITVVAGCILLLAWQRLALCYQIRKVLVTNETILAIKKGSSLDEVKNTLGMAARHEFTVMQPEGTYTLISCLGLDPDGNRFWFLFHDQVLDKMIYPIPPPSERVQYEGTTATRGKPWDVDDQTRIVETIAAPPLTQAQVVNDLKLYSGKGESWNVVPAFLEVGIMTGGLMSPAVKKEYDINFEYLKRYDGCKAKLGMSEEDIVTMFGRPLRVFSGRDGESVRIYG